MARIERDWHLAVGLTVEEKRRAIAIGKARSDHKLQYAKSRRSSDVFTDEQLDIMGAIGETAAACILGVSIDDAIHNGGDGGVDLTLPDGRSVSVKFNHRYNGYLVFEQRGDDPFADFKTDVAILVTSTCTKMRCTCLSNIESVKGIYLHVPGYITREEFISRARLVDWGLGPRAWVSVDDLTRLSVAL